MDRLRTLDSEGTWIVRLRHPESSGPWYDESRAEESPRIPPGDPAADLSPGCPKRDLPLNPTLNNHWPATDVIVSREEDLE